MSLSTLPDDARLWLFPLADPMDEAGRARLSDGMEALLARWKSHGEVLTGASWELLENQILAIAEPTMAAAPSGCAIDSMHKMIHKLATELGLALADPTAAVLARAGGRILAVAKAELEAKLRDGALDAETPVLDFAIYNLGDLRAGKLEKPLARTWIGRKYGIKALAV